MNMDQAEKHEIVIEVLAEKISRLQHDVEDLIRSRSLWMSLHDDQQVEINRLRNVIRKKTGWVSEKPAKKRGPGRPKKVKK